MVLHNSSINKFHTNIYNTYYCTSLISINMKKEKYKRSQPVLKNPDRVCVICNKKYKAVSPLQKTCSKECRKSKNKLNSNKFKLRHPDKQKEYNDNRKNKNPTKIKDQNMTR